MAITALSTGIADPKLLKTLRKMEVQFEKATPLATYEYVDVTFNSVADNDTIIVHGLNPEDPEDVDYEVVRWSFSSAPAAAPVAYADSSASRKPWNQGYIVLRCNVASANATIRLSVRRT